jgi:hypothetical protein
MLEVHGPAPRSRRWAQGMNVRVGEGSVPAECSQLVLEPAVRYPLGPPSMSEGSMRPWGCAHLRRPGGRRPAAAGRASPGGQPGVARQQAASKATSVRSPLRRGWELWSGARSSPASLEPTGHRRSDDRHAAASAGLVPPPVFGRPPRAGARAHSQLQEEPVQERLTFAASRVARASARTPPATSTKVASTIHRICIDILSS